MTPYRRTLPQEIRNTRTKLGLTDGSAGLVSTPQLEAAIQCFMDGQKGGSSA